MLDIILLGLNHKTASVAVRECIAFSKDDTIAALASLRKDPAIHEVVVFSTCNRVEILLTSPTPQNAVATAKGFMAKFNQVPLAEFEPSLYVHHGDDAVRHVFRVAASLDSMMVGEPQILGQIKEAYRLATHQKASGVILNRLLHRTFFVAKRIRTETGVGDHAVSISYAAIELGRKIFGALAGKKALLIGAGEMAELAVEHLIRHQIGSIWVANRTFERGVSMATRFNGQAIRFEEIQEALKTVDIIISSTGASELVIRREDVKAVVRSRRNRPLFFIDIAVPRDIDPDINRLPNAYVYDIDDLNNVIDENVEERTREASKAERIVDEAVIRFRQWYETLEVVPTIVSLRNKLHLIAEAELNKTIHGMPHLSEKDREALARMSQSMINKFMHDPTVFLKSNGFHGDKAAILDFTRKLFRLDDD